jgi:fatty-acyl-CoA synthase
LRRRRSHLVAAPLFHTWGLSCLLLGLQLGATQILRRKFDPVSVLVDLEAHRAEVLVPIPVMLRRTSTCLARTCASTVCRAWRSSR